MLECMHVLLFVKHMFYVFDYKLYCNVFSFCCIHIYNSCYYIFKWLVYYFYDFSENISCLKIKIKVQ